ncbi:uncharacterized protein EKO05_0008779 [Ascochyta rabiei]|uniref:uncharacterized protein n=1 Tax=Didymella rabiei TaxID=5454 RepID=UPI0022067A89|nr:uncharacterized protein EKO05_0008779 [Ascochyta rabiei]UPX18480.1 hypothetical protein EKO05_0008779 [Ascochyta rabiei]
MATGIEIAGLVLGSLPLLLAGLEFYGKGIAVTKRYWRYGREVEMLVGELRGETAVYQNSIESLVLGVVDARDVAEFLADPGGELWAKVSFERKLRKRLGASYSPYLDTILRLRAAVEKFKERLRLGSSGQPQFSDENTFKENYKRLKFSLSKADYNDLMTTIRQANTVLNRLTVQRQNIEAQQRVDRSSIPNFQIINERAQGFYSAINSGWTCLCQADHAISLRLEPRMVDVSSDDDEEEDEEDEAPMRDPFHVLFQYGPTQSIVNSVKLNPWTWDEADIHVTCESVTSIPKGTVCAVQNGKGVRFVSHAKRAVKAALEPEPNLQPIKDLCSAICTLQKPHRDVCLTLLENEIVKQRYGLKIYPTRTLPSDTEQWTVSTLRSALQRKRRFPNRERVRLAIILASSVLQLHETPWLENNWGLDNIYFVERPGFPLYDQPFVSPGLDTNVSSQTNTIPKQLGRIIQNQPLFALGVALIELWYGETLSDLHEDEDGPRDPADLQGSFLTRLNTAYRLADELADDAGAKYSDAVRRCIRCDFSLRANSLEDVQLQKAVFQGVVTQLKATHDFMC